VALELVQNYEEILLVVVTVITVFHDYEEHLVDYGEDLMMVIMVFHYFDENVLKINMLIEINFYL
jgi:hypothetical protein